MAQHTQGPEFVVAIDYDWTLADTTASSNDLWAVIAERAALPVEQAAADGESFHPSHLGGYDFEQHMQAYGLDSEIMWRAVEELSVNGAGLEPPAYLYPDSATFMRTLIYEGFQPHILSFGEDRFQRTKITPNLPHLTGEPNIEVAQTLLPLDIVLTPKGEHIARKYPGGSGVLVDDKPNQQLPTGFVEVHYDRESDLLAPEQTATGFRVATLPQALQVIRHIHPRFSQSGRTINE